MHRRVVGSMGGWVDGWVDGWLLECVRGYGCLTCFAFLFSGPMVLSPLSRRWSAAYELDTHLLLLLYVICCTAVTHGWVDRLVGVTAVLRTAVLWYRVVGGWIGLFVAVVCLRVRGLLFSFFSRHIGAALA